MNHKTRKGINVKARVAFTMSNDNLWRYLESVKGYKILTVDEELELFKQYKENNSISAKNTLIESNQRFLISSAKQFCNDESIMDLINEGNIGLITALDKYDSTMGFRFLSFASYYIKMFMINYLNNNSRTVKMPKEYKMIEGIKENFYKNKERYPSKEELQDIVKTEKNINVNFDTYSCVSINSFSSVKYDDDIENGNVEDVILSYYGLNTNDFEEKQTTDYNKYVICEALKKLKDKERNRIEVCFGFKEKDPTDNSQTDKNIGKTIAKLRNIIEKMNV